MYKRIPVEVKPIETSTKMNYACSFNPDFFLLLRERRATSLAHMQDAALEVESNILADDKLRGKDDRDRGKGRSETPTSSSSFVPPQMDEMTKLLNSLSTRMEKIELEGRQGYISSQNIENRGSFKRPTNTPQRIPRDQINRERDDKKV
jgi:hypothetical protein